MLRIDPLSFGRREHGVSAAARQLLCHFAAGDPRRPLPEVDADWAEVAEAVWREGLMGLTRFYLRQQPPSEHLPEVFRQHVKQAYSISLVQLDERYRHVGRVVKHLTAAGLDYLIVKGPAVAHTVYPDPHLRFFSDLDLVVRERDWPFADRLVRDLGFRPVSGVDLTRLPPKLSPQVALHGVDYRHPETGFLVEVHLDDLLESGLVSRDVDGFWQRAVAIEINGLPVKVLSLEDQLICLAAHAHYHAFARLAWLSDVALIVRDHSTELDWRRLVDTVRLEEAQVPVYYTLRAVQLLLGVTVPHRVLSALRPDPVRCWLHEYYLPQAHVLSLRPIAQPALSFHFVPLFLRLFPDLLVMGRRWEKLGCLLRLLAPAPEWLRHYYRLRGSQPVTVHYLLHPLKLAYHYCTEVIIAARRLLRRSPPPTDPWWYFSPSLSTRDPRALLKLLPKRPRQAIRSAAVSLALV